MYSVITGKEHVMVSNIRLATATQKELKQLHDMKHPYILYTPKAKKKDDGDGKKDGTE